MNETKLLIGSLSNDLFRVAVLTQRGSIAGAEKFLMEAKRCAVQLKDRQTKKYINLIAQDIINRSDQDISLSSAETYLMFGILLQNYSLHNFK